MGAGRSGTCTLLGPEGPGAAPSGADWFLAGPHEADRLVGGVGVLFVC